MLIGVECTEKINKLVHQTSSVPYNTMIEWPHFIAMTMTMTEDTQGWVQSGYGAIKHLAAAHKYQVVPRVPRANKLRL